MSISGIILMASIVTILALFSAVLAWGVHQTNLALREKDFKEANRT